VPTVTIDPRKLLVGHLLTPLLGDICGSLQVLVGVQQIKTVHLALGFFFDSLRYFGGYGLTILDMCEIRGVNIYTLCKLNIRHIILVLPFLKFHNMGA